jgi:hypothetical protein
MSALGQKQTYALQKAMSALPPKANSCSAAKSSLFDHLVGAAEQWRLISPGFSPLRIRPT